MKSSGPAKSRSRSLQRKLPTTTSARRVFNPHVPPTWKKNTGFHCAMLCNLQNNLQTLPAFGGKPQCTLCHWCFGTVPCTLHTAPHLGPPDIPCERCSRASGERNGRSGEVSGLTMNKFGFCLAKRSHGSLAFLPQLTQKHVHDGNGKS